MPGIRLSSNLKATTILPPQLSTMLPIQRYLWALLCVVAMHATANTNSNTLAPDDAKAVETLTRQAIANNLAGQSYWHALLHYKKTSVGFSHNVESSVISPAFFLSEQGRTNPQEELVATIAAFYQSPTTDANEHPQCRFVARYQWLRRALDWNGINAPPPIRCELYEQWSQQGSVRSVSLVFATGYLSNPASLYGHMLVKFDTDPHGKMSGLLDPSMSYGAIVPRNENGLVYVVRGLLGGYDAGFSHDKFFQHYHGYAEQELRDLWEYKLALTPDEVNSLVAHSWELLHVRFTYYFLSDNCAYEVSELLRLVVDKPLLPDLPWAIPSSILTGLDKTTHHGKPLIADVRRIPSRQNRFYENHERLDATQRRIVRNYISGKALDQQNDYQQLEHTAKIAVLATLFDYYEFQAATSSDKTPFLRKKQTLLVERMKLPAGNPTAAQVQQGSPSQAPPHKGNGPLLVQISALSNQDLGAGAEFRFRPAYYDMLSLQPGRFPYSSLSMLDARFVSLDDKLFMRTLDIVSIESLNLSKTGLPGDGGYAWKMRFGFEQQNLACIDCNVFQVEGGIGKALSISSQGALFALLDAHAQTNNENTGTFATGLHAGFIQNWSDGFATSLALGHRSYINGNYASYPLARAEVRFGASRDWDLRIKYERNIASEVSGSLSWYW